MGNKDSKHDHHHHHDSAATSAPSERSGRRNAELEAAHKVSLFAFLISKVNSFYSNGPNGTVDSVKIQ